MPSSTTLETLVLEIDSSAKGANEGIGRTVGSLRSLAKALGTVIPYLREVNAGMKALSRVRMPKIGNSITGGAKRPSASSSIVEAAANRNAPYGLDPNVWYGMSQKEQKEYEKAYRMQYHQQQLADQQRRQAELNERRRLFDESMKSNGASAITKEAQATKELAKGIKETGQAAKESEPKVSKWAKTFSTIGRIAKTMIIRAAIRSLIKAFSESWNAAYEFSKHMGGSFANAVDGAKTLLYDMATTVIQTVAPVFEALVPILKVVTDAISYLCSGIQYLLRLLGLTSDVTGAATSSINKYISASGKGGTATKNMLASWDQLNIIQSKGGSGSGGASYNPDALKKAVGVEIDAITQMIVGEGMLAVGLILASSGHIGLGIGMMAIGAAAIAKTLTQDWKKLPAEIQNTITSIMLIAGGSMLALGVILACSGNLPLGIGLIAAGVANLGIAIGLNWEDLVGKVKGIMTDIRDWFVGRWNDIKNAATNAWNKVSAWWTTNVVENIEKEGAWGGVKGFFKGVWDEVSGGATTAWTIVNDFMDENIGTSFRSAWGEVKSIFESVFGTKDDPTSVAGMIHHAFEGASEWWTTNISENFENGWGTLTEFFRGLFGDSEVHGSIAEFANDAFQDVSEWWKTNVTEKVKEEGAWGGVVGFFEGIWGNAEEGTGISGLFKRGWDGISVLWGDIVGQIETAWNGVSTWFHDNITKPIGDFFINMVNGIINNINWMIDCLNELAHIQFGGLDLGIFGKIEPFDKRLFQIPHIETIAFGANGLYGVPNGDLFVANEAGAELVGSMNGKTTVANQQQIIEGIQKGVREANQDQNELLRRQNELLLAILRKESKFELTPNAAWGNFIHQSSEIWNGMTGG